MQIESDLLTLVKDLPAFHAPILNAFTPAKLITDPEVLDRIGYNRLPQNIQKPGTVSGPQLPYLSWKGPFAYDQGQTAVLSSRTKKAVFWFMCYHQTATDAMAWASAIEDVMLPLTYPYNLPTCRLIAAMIVDKCIVAADQTQFTGKEYPLVCATIGYTFGYQAR